MRKLVPDPELNPLLDADSYKYSHHLQDPPTCTAKTYYLEARKGGDFDYTVPMGYQPILHQMLGEPLTHEYVDQAGKLIDPHGLPFAWAQWHSIVEEYHGAMPVAIDGVREGCPIKAGNILFKVRSVDPKYPWIGGFLETQLMRVWYPTTVCTSSHACKQEIRAALVKSADNPEAELPFKLHDFGARGTTGREAAGRGGLAHLVNFMGTETVQALAVAMKYYHHEGPAGFSIPAMEHGTVLSWGPDNEYSAFENFLNQFAAPGKIVAAVSDTYDIWHAIDVLWGDRLRQKVIDSGATVVIRPDSGVPEVVIVQCLEHLDAKFGHKINTKGYKVLNYVRVIQGDGMNRRTLKLALDAVMAAGYSITNVAFGMGGGLLQQVNRDTIRFAEKLCWVTDNGKSFGVSKHPVGDMGKASKAGDLDLIYGNMPDGKRQYQTIDRSTFTSLPSELMPLYRPETGIVDPPTLAEIRERSEYPIR